MSSCYCLYWNLIQQVTFQPFTKVITFIDNKPFSSKSAFLMPGGDSRDVFTWTSCSISSPKCFLMFMLHSYFPPRDVLRCQRNVLSFILIYCGYWAAGTYWWTFVLCPHFWGTSRVVPTMNSITHRGDDRPTTAEMHKRCLKIIYTAHAIFSQRIFFFFSWPPPSSLSLC